jgi:hypothetical protein
MPYNDVAPTRCRLPHCLRIEVRVLDDSEPFAEWIAYRGDRDAAAGESINWAWPLTLVVEPLPSRPSVVSPALYATGAGPGAGVAMAGGNRGHAAGWS